MTQEEKQLLLKDLCARLPYGVFIHYHWSREGNTIDEDRELDFSDAEALKYNIENPQNDWYVVSWKPYLRPLSSMTEEEKTELGNYAAGMISSQSKKPLIRFAVKALCGDFLDFFNKRHIDYRGLVPMGLALEAPEGMYENE